MTIGDCLARAESGGVIELFGSRALLLRADFLQRLRGELQLQLGSSAARALVERFEHDHGRRMAMQVRRALPDYWSSDELGSIPPLLGRSDLVSGRRLRNAYGPPTYEFQWVNSAEAAASGGDRAANGEVGCWGLCAFVDGFVSEMEGRPYHFVEAQCQGRGDACCRMSGSALNRQGTVDDDAGSGSLDRGAEALVAESPIMRDLVARARLAARSTATILLTGESGVGKERIARLVHEASSRASGPFVAFNCAAVSEALLESELFGHARGAFTGSEQDTPGVFEAAAGGSLLLDEVGEMSPAMQVMLLRALEERTVRRVGEVRERPFDVRIMCATNRLLEEEVAAGRFREDLLYRLRVIELEVPPLRTRPEDVLTLAQVFLRRVTRTSGLPAREFTVQATAALARYPWPGNVRELRNAVERAAVLCQGPAVDLGDLPREVGGQAARPAPPRIRSLAAVERQCIEDALRAFDGDKRRAAAELGIGLATLYRKLRKFADGPQVNTIGAAESR